MAAVIIESPGVGMGPCLECKHEDCAENRRDAAKPCAICAKPIGYDTKFFMDPIEGERPGVWRLTHMVCRVREIEANKVKAH